MGPSRRLRVVTAAACILAASAVTQPAARAATPPEPPLDPAIAVYVEQIPSGSGSVASTGTSGPRAEVPDAVAARIKAEGGGDAPALEEIVSSPALGAPSAAGSGAQAAGGDAAGGEIGGGGARGEPAAASLWRDERLLGLVAALLLVTAGTVLARMRQRDARAATRL